MAASEANHPPAVIPSPPCACNLPCHISASNTPLPVLFAALEDEGRYYEACIVGERSRPVPHSARSPSSDCFFCARTIDDQSQTTILACSAKAIMSDLPYFRL